jgi:short-subunit dehydrogenase
MSKVILITGGSSGIGLSIGKYLQTKGYKIYGTSRNPAKFENHPFPLLPLSMNDAVSMKKTLDHLLDLEGAIDILINNAGTGIAGPLEETPIEAIKENFQTNFFGPIELIQKILPTMRKQKKGLIINITSIAGYMGLPYRGAYSANKGAFELASEAIRMEVKSFGIEIVTIAPGDYATAISSRRYHAPLLEDSPYRKTYEANLALMNNHVGSGNDPIEVAKQVYKVIQKKSPKVHYKVGAFMQKFSVVLKTILPDKVFEKLIMKHYGL